MPVYRDVPFFIMRRVDHQTDVVGQRTEILKGLTDTLIVSQECNYWKQINSKDSTSRPDFFTSKCYCAGDRAAPALLGIIVPKISGAQIAIRGESDVVV